MECKICGRQTDNGTGLCDKHYLIQLIEEQKERNGSNRKSCELYNAR